MLVGTPENNALVSDVAMFIAAALQHPNPPCNSNVRRVSTIRVDQHKEKFNEVVVYCQLAAPEEVAAAWLEQGHEGEPTPEFRGRCLLVDAFHYRHVYRTMMRMTKDSLTQSQFLFRASYRFLLRDEIEAEDLLDEWTQKLFGATTPEELRVKLAKIYRSYPSQRMFEAHISSTNP